MYAILALWATVACCRTSSGASGPTPGTRQPVTHPRRQTTVPRRGPVDGPARGEALLACPELGDRSACLPQPPVRPSVGGVAGERACSRGKTAVRGAPDVDTVRPDAGDNVGRTGSGAVIQLCPDSQAPRFYQSLSVTAHGVTLAESARASSLCRQFIFDPRVDPHQAGRHRILVDTNRSIKQAGEFRRTVPGIHGRPSPELEMRYPG